MALRLQPDRPIGSGVIRVVRELIERATGVATSTSMSLDERVHTARTTGKKIRAALRLIRPVCPKLWRRENARFREAGRSLASLREAAVMPATLASLLKHSAKTITPHEFDAVRRQLLARRRTMMSNPLGIRRTFARLAKDMRAASRCLARAQIDGKDSPIIIKGFGQTYCRARRAWQRAKREPSTETFHEWRKCAKAHAYQYRLFRCAWPTVMRTWHGELATLGEFLGEEHDLAVLDGYLLKHISPLEGRQLAASLPVLIKARREELRAKASTLGSRLFAEKPSAVAHRIIAWWRTAKEEVANPTSRRK